MIADGQAFLTTKWELSTIPGVAVVITALGLSLVGDGLADLLTAGMSDAPILEVRDLQVEIPLTPRDGARRRRCLVHGRAPAQALGLVGESGCGKSMTLRAILGLLPQPGADHRRRDPVRRQGPGRRPTPSGCATCAARRIGMIFQEPMTALNPVMRVGDQIAEGPMAHLGHEPLAGAQTGRSS